MYRIILHSENHKISLNTHMITDLAKIYRHFEGQKVVHFKGSSVNLAVIVRIEYYKDDTLINIFKRGKLLTMYIGTKLVYQENRIFWRIKYKEA